MSTPKEVPGLHEYLSGVRTIDDAFKVYRRYVMPAAADQVQVTETRRAFFAAADWFFKRLLLATDDEREGEAFLSGIQAELDAHCKAVQEGRA